MRGKLQMKVWLGVALALVLAGAVVGQTQKATMLSCKQVPIKGSLRWISSAVSVDSKIAVIDPLQNALAVVGRDGSVEAINEKRLVGSSEEMVPALITPKPGGFLLKMVDQRLLLLGQRLGVVERRNLSDVSKSAKGSIKSVYDWTTTGRYLLGVGAVKSDGAYKFGYFRAPINSLEAFEFLDKVENLDLFLIGHNYLAGVGNTGYYVSMADEAAIYEIPALAGAKPRKLSVFPQGYTEVPEIRNVSTGASSDEALYREIQSFKIPVGLYAQGRLLYLLTRERQQDDTTLWLLHQIDPVREVILGKPIPLPTKAAHLTVVPGSTWTFFEKGPVDSLGQQRIASMLLIPAASIESHSVPTVCQSSSR